MKDLKDSKFEITEKFSITSCHLGIEVKVDDEITYDDFGPINDLILNLFSLATENWKVGKNYQGQVFANIGRYIGENYSEFVHQDIKAILAQLKAQ